MKRFPDLTGVRKMGHGRESHVPDPNFKRPVKDLVYKDLQTNTLTRTSHDRGIKTWCTSVSYPQCLCFGNKWSSKKPFFGSVSKNPCPRDREWGLLPPSTYLRGLSYLSLRQLRQEDKGRSNRDQGGWKLRKHGNGTSFKLKRPTVKGNRKGWE